MHRNIDMNWQRIIVAAVDKLLQTCSALNGDLFLLNLALNGYIWE
jgi:hypothetical protein